MNAQNVITEWTKQTKSSNWLTGRLVGLLTVLWCYEHLTLLKIGVDWHTCNTSANVRKAKTFVIMSCWCVANCFSCGEETKCLSNGRGANWLVGGRRMNESDAGCQRNEWARTNSHSNTEWRQRVPLKLLYSFTPPTLGHTPPPVQRQGPESHPLKVNK